MPSRGAYREAWRADYARRHPRLPPSDRGYDADWRELRERVLAAEPYCRACARKGIERLAQMVDHIQPIRRAPERRLDPLNLQPLCWPCHNRKLNRADGGFGNSKTDRTRLPRP